MTVTVSGTNYSQINACEATTNWTGPTSIATDTMNKQGTYSLSGICKTSGSNDITYTPASPIDLSGTKHLRMWFLTTNIKLLQTDALGGLQFFVTGGGNTGYWYVGGGTTYQGGWINLVIDTSRACDAGTKPTMTSISALGVRMVLTAAGKNAVNTWWDNLIYCDGLTCYGDVGGSPFSLSDVYAVDAEPTTGGWGIIRKISGVYYVVGSLTFGDTSGTTTTNYSGQNGILVFENRKVNSSLYAITVTGNSTNKTSFQYGSKAGDAGTSGNIIRTEVSSQTPKWTFDGSSANVSTLKLYGSTFVDFTSFTLPASAANKEIIGCSFDSAGEVVGTTIPMAACNILNADSHGYHVSSTTFGITGSNFVSCPYAVDLAVSGTFSFDGLKFYNNTIDVLTSVSASLQDSYAETNKDTYVNLNTTTGIYGVGQAFSGSTAGYLPSFRFNLAKNGTPAGNVEARLYLADASSPKKPSGSVLAISDAVAATDLPSSGSATNTLFVFTGDTNHYSMASGTVYFATIYYPSGTSTDYIMAGYKATGSHGGNYASYSGSTWTGDSNKDLCFYAYRDGIVTINCSNDANPSTSKVSNVNYASTTINNGVTIKVTVYNTAGDELENVRVGIYKTSDNTEIYNQLTNASGYVSTSYNYSGDVPIYVRIRKTSPGSTRYFNIDASGIIESTGYSATFTLIEDTVASTTV